VALKEHGFSVEVVADLDAALQAVLAHVSEGSSVMTNASVTLEETGIADAVNDGGGRWESAGGGSSMSRHITNDEGSGT
jgi:hypothetical protein